MLFLLVEVLQQVVEVDQVLMEEELESVVMVVKVLPLEEEE